MDFAQEHQIRWILRRTAALVEFGAEPVNGLVLPTGDFFPDRFDSSPKAVASLLGRIQEHAGLTDIPSRLQVVSPEGEAEQVGCTSGACGGGGKMDVKLERIKRDEEGVYTISISTGEVRNPVVLTTALVRAVTFMFLTEAGAYARFLPTDREAVTDLAGVLLGFGVLLANGSYIYAKGCGGVAVHSATKMPVAEVTLGLALFCALFDVPPRTGGRHLTVTPSECFDEAVAWTRSNANVVGLVRSNPRALEDDRLALAPARSWLSRALFGKKRSKTPDDEIAELERAVESAPRASLATRDPDKQKKLAELRALVEESLEG